MISESEAAQRPLLTGAFTFLFASPAITLLVYFRSEQRNFVVAALIGIGVAIGLTAVIIGRIGQLRGWPAWISGRPGHALGPPIGLTLLWPGVGIGIVLWGLMSGSLDLALAGIPLLALGGLWYLIKRNIRR